MKRMLKINSKLQTLITLDKKSVCKVFLAISFIFLVLSTVAQIYFSNTVAIRGSELADLGVRKESLQKEISLLNHNIMEISSLSYLESKAYDLGYLKTSDPLLVLEQSYFAAATKR